MLSPFLQVLSSITDDELKIITLILYGIATLIILVALFFRVRSAIKCTSKESRSNSHESNVATQRTPRRRRRHAFRKHYPPQRKVKPQPTALEALERNAAAYEAHCSNVN